jgi:hypothetical protein
VAHEFQVPSKVGCPHYAKKFIKKSGVPTTTMGWWWSQGLF